jgi:hypothetical protein
MQLALCHRKSRNSRNVQFTLAVVVAFTSSPAYCADSVDVIVSRIEKIMRPAFAPYPKERRLALATQSHAYWLAFNKRIPRLSPDTTKWLLGEMSNTDVERVGRAVSSREYQLYDLESFSTLCASNYEYLIRNINQTPLMEMYGWLKVTQCYNKKNLPYQLELVGLKENEQDKSFGDQHYYAVYSEIIGSLSNTIVEETYNVETPKKN